MIVEDLNKKLINKVDLKRFNNLVHEITTYKEKNSTLLNKNIE